MPTIIELRRGDDLVVRATFTDLDGMPPPGGMTGWALEATLRFPDCPAIDLTATWIDDAGGVGVVRYDAADTASLVIGDHELRVRAINPAGDATSTQPVHIRVTD